MVPVNICAYINADNIAFLDHPPAGDPMDDLIIDRNTGAFREAAKAQEGRFGALGEDKLPHDTVQFTGRNAGPYSRTP